MHMSSSESLIATYRSVKNSNYSTYSLLKLLPRFGGFCGFVNSLVVLLKFVLIIVFPEQLLSEVKHGSYSLEDDSPDVKKGFESSSSFEPAK